MSILPVSMVTMAYLRGSTFSLNMIFFSLFSYLRGSTVEGPTLYVLSREMERLMEEYRMSPAS